MKKIFYVIIFILASPALFAQEVTSSAGNYTEAGGVQLSWTLGEPVIETVTNGNTILTQGFHQTNLTVTAIGQLQAADMSLKVYPNPTSDFIKIELENETGPINYSLFDLNGKLIFQDIITDINAKIPMSNYETGVYFLEVSNKNKRVLQTFKIVKQ